MKGKQQIRFKRKRAVLFSLMSLLFSVLFVTIFSQNFKTTYEDRLPSTNIRVKVMDVYVKNLDSYLEYSIRTSTYRSLDAMTRYMDTHGFFDNYDEFNRTFGECMLCGYTNCSQKISANNCSISGYDLSSRLDNIRNLSEDEMNIEMEYEIKSIEISQNHPFRVQVSVNISYNVTDSSGNEYYARWDRQKSINQSVSIAGLLDPLGYINDPGHDANRTIIIYQGNGNFDPKYWNPSTTLAFYNERSYRYYANGQSFMQRYWNDSTPSNSIGIETLVHPGDIASIDPDNTYVDTLYWTNRTTCDNGAIILKITLGSDEVHLDDATAARYNVSGPTHCE